MIELFFNEFLSTFPFHILACVPFHKKLRHSPWKTFLWVCGFELGYLLLFLFLIQIGLSSVWVQYLALPCFGVLFKLIVDAESGMILFLYLFIIDYLLVVRAAAFCICQALFGYNFFSWETGLVTFLLVLCSIYFMAKAMTRTVEGLSSVSIPSFWNTASAAPRFCNPDSSAFNWKYPKRYHHSRRTAGAVHAFDLHVFNQSFHDPVYPAAEGISGSQCPQ